MKPQTTTDVEVLLSEVIGGAKKLTSLVDIYKEKGKRCCLVKPRKYLSHMVWCQIHKKIKEWGGKWRRAQQLWDIPLNERREIT